MKKTVYNCATNQISVIEMSTKEEARMLSMFAENAAKELGEKPLTLEQRIETLERKIA